MAAAARKAARRREPGELYQRIWDTVARIPSGRVATYGQVAQLAGIPRRARLVGYALHALPRDSDLPWHRVINAQGRISFPARSAAWKRQRAALEEEGVVFLRGRIDLERYRWHPADPSPLLD